MLLFVHGSPGDWKAWAHYLQSPELACFSSRVAVDRPGFGGSRSGGVMPDLRAQAAMLTKLIPKGQKAIVVGHSLGGPLVAWMAIDAPDKVCGAVSIAGSLSSAHEAPRWYNHLADLPLVKWVIPAEMVESNHEMMPLADELAKLEPYFVQLQVPLIVMQGGKDSLVDPVTADEVEKHSPRIWVRVQRLPMENHFLLWEKPQLVIDAIQSLPCAP
jgi:pimeloyl-ACP methyl ester carboxylesterase